MNEARTETAAPSWDLVTIFPSPTSRELALSHEGLVAELARIRQRFDELDVRGGDAVQLDDATVAAFDEVVVALNDIEDRVEILEAYLWATVSADSRDDAAQRTLARLMADLAEHTRLTNRFRAWVGRLGASAIVSRSALAAEHAYLLERSELTATHLMSEPEESLLADLHLTGGAAWQRLHGDVTSALYAEVTFVDGRRERLPMTVVRALANDPDASVRRAAYEAELAAWRTVEIPLAAALNGIKGEWNTVHDRRRWHDPIDVSLHVNGIDRTTFDAMHEAVVESLPTLRRYLRAKAVMLASAGTNGGLPWWDLFAPVAQRDAAPRWSWGTTLDEVRAAFSSYSPKLASLLARSIERRWVDAEPRAGKRGGAFCIHVGDGESRILMTFDGSINSAQTLAHELGHAYHNTQLAGRTPLQRGTPMTLAETASIFCETMVTTAALASASASSARALLLDAELQNATQVVIDIHSRLLFEQQVFARRRQAPLSPTELCELMLDSQRLAYGDGLDPQHLHAYMWAVKPHYYSSNFYNWPYTFGLLFGIGLYARFVNDPDRFRGGFDELLSATGLAAAPELTRRFDIDVRDAGFWRSSLATISERVDEFCALA